FFFSTQQTAYELQRSLVGSEMCIGARIAAAPARDDVGGRRFADALARYPSQFGTLYRQLIEVGDVHAREHLDPRDERIAQV
ncbi:hypothetical protein, partial [Burkholderia cenocepacia]|uniref:hypothetical protein n=1 Tax=Burkholderia cenocepacia TaxID=95486 RepID=UPI0024B74F09